MCNVFVVVGKCASFVHIYIYIFGGYFMKNARDRAVHKETGITTFRNYIL